PHPPAGRVRPRGPELRRRDSRARPSRDRGPEAGALHLPAPGGRDRRGAHPRAGAGPAPRTAPRRAGGPPPPPPPPPPPVSPRPGAAAPAPPARAPEPP